MDHDGITDAALPAPRDDGSGMAGHVIAGTDRRDVLTATARRGENKGTGSHVSTTYRLDGERVPPRAVQPLSAAYGKGNAS